MHQGGFAPLAYPPTLALAVPAVLDWLAMPRVSLPSGTSAELARPADERAPSRGLVIAPDIFGLRPLFDDMCRRLADENGWAVIAVEPFPGREHLPLEERVISSNDDADTIGDLVAAADHLDVESVGLIGFCQGGMWTFKGAGTGRFHRAVSFYGMIRMRSDRPEHGEPLDFLAKPECCPVLAIIGALDPYTPPDDVDALRALPHVEVVAYPEAEHGFVHAPERPAHRPDDAADAWLRATSFLSAT